MLRAPGHDGPRCARPSCAEMSPARCCRAAPRPVQHLSTDHLLPGEASSCSTAHRATELAAGKRPAPGCGPPCVSCLTVSCRRGPGTPRRAPPALTRATTWTSTGPQSSQEEQLKTLRSASRSLCVRCHSARRPSQLNMCLLFIRMCV